MSTPEQKVKRSYDVKKVRKLRHPKKDIEQESTEDRNNRMDKLMAIPKQRKGRKRKFTPTTLRNRINDYFEYCRQKDFVPNITGVYMYLNINHDTWYAYRQREEFKDICALTYASIENWMIDDLWNSPANSNKQLVAKQVLGWTDKQEVVTTQVLTVDSAMAKLERLAPYLLEAMKLQIPINQVEEKDLILVNPQ